MRICSSAHVAYVYTHMDIHEIENRQKILSYRSNSLFIQSLIVRFPVCPHQLYRLHLYRLQKWMRHNLFVWKVEQTIFNTLGSVERENFDFLWCVCSVSFVCVWTFDQQVWEMFIAFFVAHRALEKNQKRAQNDDTNKKNTHTVWLHCIWVLCWLTSWTYKNLDASISIWGCICL